MIWCRSILVFCLSFFLFSGSFAQDFKSEAELKKKAELLFDEQDYVSAFPLFSQLLSLYPKDPNYNFKFGVCLLFTTEDKEKPLKYLEFASKKPETEKEIFFFLGRAYHLNYRFTDAIIAYENFKKSGNAKSLKKYEVDQHINMCKSGSTLLRNVRDLYVIDKKSSRDEDFFRAYNADGAEGKLIVKPDEFKTSLDKKKKENSVIFLPKNGNEVYISSYGADEKNGKDIYRIKKLPDGSFGAPENIGTVVNTSFDEDFPFMHPDGKTLYFSSKGHNSMGGYDVFKSTYNAQTNTWTQPVNLDFAISTPDDDILYMPDSSNTYAYFASRRNSPAGNLDVYKLRIDQKPAEVALIKGTLASEIGSGSKAARIIVKNANGERLGEFATNDKTGEYLVSVPNGGKFTFQVESDVMAAREEVVEVPTQLELRALRQTILVKPDKLIITNYFDEILSDESSYMAAVNFLKERANLQVNFDNQQAERPKSEELSDNSQSSDPIVKPADNTTAKTEIKATPAATKFSNTELLSIAKEDAVESRKDAEELQDKSDNALYAGKTKEEEAKQKSQSADEIVASASGITDPVKKEEELAKAAQLKKESELLNKEAEAVKLLAQNLYKESQEKFKEAKQNEEYATQLEAAIKSNSKESIIKLTEQQALLEATAAEEKENDFGMQQLKAETDAKQDEADRAEKKLEELQKSLADAEAEQNSFREQAANTKNKKDKEVLNQQADILTPDIEEKRKQVAEQKEKASIARSEATVATDQLATFTKVLGGETIAAVENSSENNSKTNEQPSAVVKSDAAAVINTVNENFESKVTSTASMPDGPEKQKAIAQAYDQWGAALQTEAENRKEKLKTVTDPTEKILQTDVILKLESASSEKLALAADARSSADVATNASNNTAVTSSNSTAVVEKIKSDQASINTEYDGALKSVESISDPADREKSKTVVYDNWVKALEKQASSVRTDINNTTDAGTKAALENQLKELDITIAEKRNQASMTFAKAERLNKEKNAAAAEPIVASSYTASFEERLKNSDTITNEPARLQEKSRIHEEWTAEIKKEKIEKEQQLASEADASIKASLTKKIEELSQLEQQHQQLSSQNKEASVIAANNTVQPVAVNNVKPAVESKNSPVAIMALNDSFEKKIAETNTISDSLKKQEEVARINAEWSKELTATAEKIRIDAGNETDESKKKIEFLRADELETVAKEKQNESLKYAALATNSNSGNNNPVTLESGNKAETPAGTNESANSSAEPQILKEPAPVETARYEASISSAENETDEIKKAREKTNVYDRWASDLEKQVVYLKEKKKQTADTAEVRTIDNKLAELEKELLEKRTKASLNVARADRLTKEREALANNRADQQNVNTVSSNDTAAVKISAATANEPAVNNNNVTVKSAGPSPAVLAKLNQAARLKHESDSIRTNLVSLPNKEQRATALSKSGQLEKESYIARVEASDEMSSESKVSYNSNKGKITQFQNSTARNQSDEVTMANMLATESDYYFKEAATIRTAVQQGEPSVPKITALERAEEYEKLAVEKQEKAINLYQKAGGTLVQNTPSNPRVIENRTDVALTAQKSNSSQDTTTIKTSVSPEPSTNPSARTANDTVIAKAITVQKDSIQPADTSVMRPDVTARKFANASDSVAAIKATTEADRLDHLAAAEEKSASEFKVKSQSEMLASDSLRAEAEKPERSGERETLLSDSKERARLSSIYLFRADSIQSLANNSREASKAKKEEAQLLASYKPAVKQNPVSANTNEQAAAKNETSESVNKTATPAASQKELADAGIPADYLTETNELKREIFQAFANQAAYSAKRPIPINEKLPKGLVYKVQVGAFRNPIAPEVLKGFAPLMGETTGNGITRYTAGLFKSFESASAARREIVSMGYRDAFVVAFCNGKRISNNEAQEIIRSGKPCPDGTSSAVSVAQNTGTVQKQNETDTQKNTAQTQTENVQKESEAPVNNTVQPPANSNASSGNEIRGAESIAQNVPVEKVTGLFYTVQIGVFSARVPASKINYLQPVYSETVDNGKVRYSVGIYDDLELAKKARGIVKDFGINDAFVTAYVNGKRISVAEAGKIATEKGRSAFATDPVMNKMPEAGYGNQRPEPVSNPVKSDQKTGNEKQTPAGKNDVEVPVTNTFIKIPAVYLPMSDTGLVFRVQIGAFRDEVPVDIAAKFIKIADKGINHYVSSDSLTIYTVGGSRDHQSASALKDEVVANGLSDSFVVAYRRGIRIPLEEALIESSVKY